MTRFEAQSLPVIDGVLDPPGFRLLSRSFQLRTADELNVALGLDSYRTPRTDAFAQLVLDLADRCDGIVPYAFRTELGSAVALDWGCLGYLAKHTPAEIKFDLDHDGYVVAVRPTPALRLRYGRPAPLDDDRLMDDLDALRRSTLDVTTRERLIDARVGQGRYRDDLMRRWQGRCVVTGCAITAVLRASHIKPWRNSSNQERLDPANGLLLSAHYDALFDRGLITFSPDGAVMVAPEICEHIASVLDPSVPLRVAFPANTEGYLNWHRSEVFRDGPRWP